MFSAVYDNSWSVFVAASARIFKQRCCLAPTLSGRLTPASTSTRRHDCFGSLIIVLLVGKQSPVIIVVVVVVVVDIVVVDALLGFPPLKLRRRVGELQFKLLHLSLQSKIIRFQLLLSKR